MPIYEYRCGECSQVFEALQRVRDEPLDTCRLCGGPAERIISSPAIHFVGSGWYVTDYARKGEKGKEEGKEKGEKAASGGKGKEEGSAGAAKNGGGDSGGSSGNGGTGAAGRSSGSGGKASGGRTSGERAERRAGAAT